MTIAEDIKAKLDIVDYINRFVSLKKGGRNFKACCPFHNESTPSFTVSPERQSWHCFGQCNTGGDVISFAMRHRGWSFGEALIELGKIVGIEVKPPSPSQKSQDERAERLRGLLAAAADMYQKCLLDWKGAAQAREYLQVQRGLTDDTIKRFTLGYAPPKWDTMVRYLKQLGYNQDEMIASGIVVKGSKGLYDFLRDRIVFPICDPRGRVIAFAGRSMDGSEPKYLNTGETVLFQKGHTLYGYWRESLRDTAVIVEGYMDVIQAHQAGFTNVVAQMGTALTEQQVSLLKHSAQIVLALDGDAAGEAATRSDLTELVKSSRDVRVLRIANGQDPDDLIRQSPDAWTAQVESAIGVAEYLINAEVAALPPDATFPQRLEIVKRLLPILIECETHLGNMWNAQLLALRLNMDAVELANMAARLWTNRPLPTPPPAPARVKTPLEGLLLASYLGSESAFLDMVVAFDELDLPEPSAEDFTDPDYREIMIVYRAATNQLDLSIEDYFTLHLDEQLRPIMDDLIAKPPQRDPLYTLADCALMLRRHRLQVEIDNTDDPEAMMERVRQRARIQYR